MRNCSRNTSQTFFLERSIEPFDVRVVVALPNARVSMCEIFPQKDMRESCREFWAMVSLYHFKGE
jgi:hypothetical protein